MKQLFIFSILLFLQFSSQAQQLPVSSFSQMYPVMHNPAAAGSTKQSSIGATFRTQWSRMPGSPQTGLLYGSTYLPDYKIGLGGYLYTDVTGPTRRTGLQLAYAYHIPLKEESTISVGIEGRFQQFSFDRAKLQEALGTADPVVNNRSNTIKGDAGLGVYFNSKKWTAGASVSQLAQSKLNLYDGAKSQLYRHYYLQSSYNWNVDGFTNIKPGALLIYLPNAPVELQGGVTVEHDNLFWYGVNWRMRQGWMLSAGLKVAARFNIGYAFDVYRKPMGIYESGSNGHELMLRYDFIK